MGSDQWSRGRRRLVTSQPAQPCASSTLVATSSTLRTRVSPHEDAVAYKKAWGAAVWVSAGRRVQAAHDAVKAAHDACSYLHTTSRVHPTRPSLSQCGTAKAPPRDLAPIADTTGATAAITTSSVVAGGAVKLRGSRGPPFNGLGRASGGARAGVDCSFAAIISGANSECDCAVVALVAPSHLAPPARALKSASSPGSCRPRVESNLIGARGLPYRRRGA